MTKEVLFKLEELVLYAEGQRKKVESADGIPTVEELTAKAYEDGAFAAYAIVKKIANGGYDL